MLKLYIAVAAAVLMAQQASALNKADASIARYAALYANNRFAKEFTDEKGMALFLLARKLTPKAEVVIVLEALLERQVHPAPKDVKADEEKFIRYVLKQAIETCPKDPAKNPKASSKCLTYYRLAELYFPQDKDVILGVAKLRAVGYDGSFDTALCAEWDIQPSAAQPGGETKPVATVAPPVPATVDPKNLKLSVKLTKKKDKQSGGMATTRTDKVELKVTLENQNRANAEGLKVEALVIAERVDRRKTYYVASRKETGGINLVAKRKHEFIAIKADIVEREVSFGGFAGRRGMRHSGGTTVRGGEYQAWLVVLRDSNDKILKIEGSDYSTEKVAEKILKFEDEQSFNRKGEKI